MALLVLHPQSSSQDGVATDAHADIYEQSIRARIADGSAGADASCRDAEREEACGLWLWRTVVAERSSQDPGIEDPLLPRPSVSGKLLNTLP